MFTAHDSARCGGGGTTTGQPEAIGACPPGVNAPKSLAYGGAERTGDSDAGRETNLGGAERAPDDEPDGSDICDGDCGTDLTNLTWLTELRCQRSLTWPPNVDDEDDCYEEQSDEDGAGSPEKRLKSLRGVTNSGPSVGPEPAGAGRDAAASGAHAAAKDMRCKTPKRALHYAPPKRKQQPPGKGDGGAEAGAPNAPTKRPTPTERYEMFLDKVKRDLDEYEQYAAAYQSDVNEKPPFNYSHIIGMSMLQNGRVTLQQICSWIESKFAYFRVRKKWNNSIRHNLSLHHCFRKINRNKYEKGKGGYWELGLDPKKCDRKRIRNRKSTKAKAKSCAPPQPPLGAEDLGLEPPGADRDPPAQLFLADCVQHASHMVTATDAPACPPLSEIPVSPNAATLGCGDLQPQHYQLGTIIISTLSADVNGANHDFQSVEDEANQHIAYLPIIVNSSNPVLPEGIDGDCISLEPSDSLTLPIEPREPPQQGHHTNVVVEQSDPRNACYMIATPALSSVGAPSAAPMASHSPTHCDYANIISDNFRPYIDGIEEAFQYLRSMDNNREDILDNLLDISVSDY